MTDHRIMSRGATPPPARGICPTCLRRHRAPETTRAVKSLPLFEWKPPQRPEIRLIRLPYMLTPDGFPSPALLVPGRRVPMTFRSIGAAMRAKAAMEARA